MTYNYSRQREAIEANLKLRKDHPTAEAVYGSLRESMPNLSLGTVYRNLNLLAGIGKIRRFSDPKGVVHFDADVSEHQHFMCTKCGRVDDVYLSGTEELDRKASECINESVAAHDIFFYGLCSNCRQ